MQLTSNSFTNGDAIPSDFAFGKHHPINNVELCPNKNPQLSWTDAPEGTKSFVLLCVDTEVPTVGDDVNQAGKTVPHTLPRCDFYHWVMVDIPVGVNSIAEGYCSDGITAGGKQSPTGPGRQGINDYTGWFAGDADMAGDYYGYDGPCPPWNDERVHQYRFQLFATDLECCEVDGAFTGGTVLAAIEGHVLAQAELVGSYHIYPDAK
ncbi:MAG: YbhB/YbcL family Raf kinase inhibitor-like protein [Gammaproteobacteria bacterium]|nr:YbhB/YbcL family Raf kinase inhibitor-like protein [Gammaproteobacteria bacterium]